MRIRQRPIRKAKKDDASQLHRLLNDWDVMVYHGDLHDLMGELYEKYHFKIIGVGLGREGCLLCVEGRMSHYPSLAEEVVNTVGAGVAFISSFLHFYGNGDKPETAITKALFFVAEKIKYKTASEGFMDKETFLMRYGER